MLKTKQIVQTHILVISLSVANVMFRISPAENEEAYKIWIVPTTLEKKSRAARLPNMS
jgi:hypothetical protein